MVGPGKLWTYEIAKNLWQSLSVTGGTANLLCGPQQSLSLSNDEATDTFIAVNYGSCGGCPPELWKLKLAYGGDLRSAQNRDTGLCRVPQAFGAFCDGLIRGNADSVSQAILNVSLHFRYMRTVQRCAERSYCPDWCWSQIFFRNLGSRTPSLSFRIFA